MFLCFGTMSLCSLIYFIFIVEHTSQFEKNDEGVMELVKLNEKEKKELYWPREHKVQPIIKNIKTAFLSNIAKNVNIQAVKGNDGQYKINIDPKHLTS